MNHLFLWAMFHGYVKWPEGITVHLGRRISFFLCTEDWWKIVLCFCPNCCNSKLRFVCYTWDKWRYDLFLLGFGYLNLFKKAFLVLVIIDELSAMGYLTKNMMFVFSTNGRFHKWWGWFNHEKSQKNVFHMAIQHERPRDFVTFFVEVNLGKL